MSTFVRHMNLAWEQWLYGLIWATIGGAATAASAWMGMGAAHASGLDVPALNLNALGVILASGALTNFFAFLKQTPLPAEEKTATPPPPANEKSTEIAPPAGPPGSS